MIKYKLIKEYPGSDKIGTIYYYDGLNNRSEYWKGVKFYNLYPEFFEFVENKIQLNSGDVINDGDVVFSVNLIDFEIYKSVVNFPYITDESYKDFSLLENAESFIKLNKPVYSLKDIFNVKLTESESNPNLILIDFTKLKDVKI